MSRIYSISSDGGYPLGADQDPKAPWKEKPVNNIEIPVVVSITLHKYMNVSVPENYKELEYNYLNEAAYEKLKRFIYKVKEDNWIEDEFETIEDI